MIFSFNVTIEKKILPGRHLSVLFYSLFPKNLCSYFSFIRFLFFKVVIELTLWGKRINVLLINILDRLYSYSTKYVSCSEIPDLWILVIQFVYAVYLSIIVPHHSAFPFSSFTLHTLLVLRLPDPSSNAVVYIENTSGTVSVSAINATQ